MKIERKSKERSKRTSFGLNSNRVLLHKIEGLQISLEEKKGEGVGKKKALEAQVLIGVSSSSCVGWCFKEKRVAIIF